jgi:hypothetical protein
VEVEVLKIRACCCGGRDIVVCFLLDLVDSSRYGNFLVLDYTPIALYISRVTQATSILCLWSLSD